MVKLKNAMILSLFVVFLPFLALSQNNELTPEMVVQLKSLTDVDLSPDGNIIVYSVRIPRSIQEEPGPAYSELWLLDRQTSEKRQLTLSGIISRTPQWSPGGNDRRVDSGQAWELYRALQFAGVGTEFVVYPGAGHGLSTTQHQLDFLKRSLQWFERYLLIDLNTMINFSG